MTIDTGGDAAEARRRLDTASHTRRRRAARRRRRPMTGFTDKREDTTPNCFKLGRSPRPPPIPCRFAQGRTGITPPPPECHRGGADRTAARPPRRTRAWSRQRDPDLVPDAIDGFANPTSFCQKADEEAQDRDDDGRDDDGHDPRGQGADRRGGQADRGGPRAAGPPLGRPTARPGTGPTAQDDGERSIDEELAADDAWDKVTELMSLARTSAWNADGDIRRGHAAVAAGKSDAEIAVCMRVSRQTRLSALEVFERAVAARERWHPGTPFPAGDPAALRAEFARPLPRQAEVGEGVPPLDPPPGPGGRKALAELP